MVTVSIVNIVLTALLAAFLILLMDKTGLREKGQIYGPKIVSRMLNCDFCLSFWVNIIVLIVIYIPVTHDWTILIIALFSTPITRKMI